LKYKANSTNDLPPGTTEWWEVEIGWASTQTNLYSTKEEAETYARKRLNDLIKHPTAGPKLNDKKAELTAKWNENPNETFKITASHHYTVVLTGTASYLVLGTQWESGTFSVRVVHHVRF